MTEVLWDWDPLVPDTTMYRGNDIIKGCQCFRHYRNRKRDGTSCCRVESEIETLSRTPERRLTS